MYAESNTWWPITFSSNILIFHIPDWAKLKEIQALIWWLAAPCHDKDSCLQLCLRNGLFASTVYIDRFKAGYWEHPMMLLLPNKFFRLCLTSPPKRRAFQNREVHVDIRCGSDLVLIFLFFVTATSGTVAVLFFTFFYFFLKFYVFFSNPWGYDRHPRVSKIPASIILVQSIHIMTGLSRNLRRHKVRSSRPYFERLCNFQDIVFLKIKIVYDLGKDDCFISKPMQTIFSYPVCPMAEIINSSTV